ncbi:glycosyltransferase family 2 protein [Microbulbifer discodermiae]|uniref:glycosyltransferase family 2 protein n=1 Tax=Microbulbifer sp. 2201CG32-9 TaxID=3232309 RepID=UPI00345B65EF
MSGNYVTEKIPSRLQYSVIVPVYEQWNLIRRLLSCLDVQVLDRECFEVILVDNGSVNFRPSIDLPSSVTVLHCNKPGSYSARNVGAKHAKGRWFVFTDADCEPSDRWLSEIDAKIRRIGRSDVLVAGHVEVYSSSKKPTAYEIYDVVKGIPQRRYVEEGFAVTANLVVPGSLWQKLGGFDEITFSGGDVDFCQRAVRNGAVLTFLEQAVVRHPARKTKQKVVAKARRVKGGQLRSRAVGKRVISALRTITPPMIAIWRILIAKQHTIKFRMFALGVQLQLWVVELNELLRCLIGGAAERR